MANQASCREVLIVIAALLAFAVRLHGRRVSVELAER